MSTSSTITGITNASNISGTSIPTTWTYPITTTAPTWTFPITYPGVGPSAFQVCIGSFPVKRRKKVEYRVLSFALSTPNLEEVCIFLSSPPFESEDQARRYATFLGISEFSLGLVKKFEKYFTEYEKSRKVNEVCKKLDKE